MKVINRSATLLILSMLPGFATASHWSYEGADSPEHWSEISPENAQCKQGMNQSPINIDTTLKAHIMPLKTQFSDSPVSILNNGHTVQANFSPDTKDQIDVDGVPFTLQQLHFHAPAENTIHGKQYPMEMHLVYKNADSELVVVAVMFDAGKENSELAKLWQAMPAEANTSTPLTQKIDVNHLLPTDKTYYRFSGSLTTPPCSEGVTWLVLKHPQTLSQEQLEAFASVMHHANNRPVQPPHGRVVVE